MKLLNLPKIVVGLDVLSEETSLPAGAVRRAENVVLDRKGGFRRRRGYELAVASPGVHSVYGARSRPLTLAANDITLYRVVETDGVFSLSALFNGLTPGVPVGYAEENGEVWFTQPGLVVKVLAGSYAVRKPGIADLTDIKPSVAAFASGSMAAGRYGVAYSLVNDQGEESGLSDTVYIDSPGGGLILGGLQVGYGYVSYVRIYLTAPNDEVLYLVAEEPAAALIFLTQPMPSTPAAGQYRAPLSGGRHIAHFNGRTYIAAGSTLEYSDAFAPGLRDARSSSIGFPGEITMLMAVDGGLFVGQEDQVWFLAGGGPKDFKQVLASPHGARGQGAVAPAAAFNPEVAPPGQDCVVWLSDVGFVLGLPNGSTKALQADRLALTTTGEAATAVATRRGVKQAISVVESMSLTGSADATDSTLS